MCAALDRERFPITEIFLQRFWTAFYVSWWFSLALSKPSPYCRTGNFRDTKISRIRDFCEFLDLNRGDLWIEVYTLMLQLIAGSYDNNACTRIFPVIQYIDHSPPCIVCKMHLNMENVVKNHNLSPFDLDLRPTTLTYNPSLAKVKVNYNAKNQGQRSNGSNRRVPISKQTHRRTLPNVLSPLLRGR